MDVRIRLATEADYSAAGEVCVAAYQADGQLAGGYENTLRDVAARALHGQVFVAVDESERVIGSVTYVLAGQRYAELSKPGEAEFRMLAVDPSARGSGIGAALVQACIDTAISQGITALVICVRDWNTAAQRLYSRFGFQRVPELDWSPLEDVLLIGLRLDLPVRVAG